MLFGECTVLVQDEFKHMFSCDNLSLQPIYIQVMCYMILYDSSIL